MIKRAMISGLNSTGVDVADLRCCPPPVGRHLLKAQNFDAGVPRRRESPLDPEVVADPASSSSPGIQLSAALQKEIEKHFTRAGAAARRRSTTSATITYPARAARELRATTCSRRSTPTRSATRGFRIVVDYGYSAASFVLPLVLGPLGVEVVSRARVRVGRAPTRPLALRRDDRPGEAASSRAVGADLGVVFDRAAERLYLVDEHGARGAASSRRCCSSCACSATSGRQRQARVPDHRHEPGRPDRRGQRARGRAHAGVARRR